MKKYLLLTLCIPLFSGCASITKGTSQTLIFNLEPPETNCSLSRIGDGEIGSISGKNNTIVVGKDKDDITVKCNASGFKQKALNVKSSTETAGVVGGVFLDLGITDMITGAMWAYPSSTSISLEKCDATQTSC
ncbi:MAG: hypothetical protein HOP25_10780 [Methylotenera sp.]|nr:hypothetical protein [Methylotenera sp.]